MRKFGESWWYLQRRESDGIDYVRDSPTDLWRATNIDNLHFTGVEASVSWKPTQRQQFDLRYTGLHGEQDTLAPGVISQYAFNFPSNQGVAAWRVSLPWGVIARTRVGALQRLGQDAYALWDVYVGQHARPRPSVPAAVPTSLTPLTRKSRACRCLGRGVIGGVEIAFLAHTK